MADEAPKKRILFVDDEPNVLAGLRTLLRRYRTRWEMAFAGSGEEALRLFAEKPYDVIVSDLRMPKMGGAELLHRIRSDYPGAVRIVLSGEAEVGAGLKVAAEAHQFLSKPCNPEALERAVEQSCQLQSRLADPTLRRIVGQTDSLPTVPATYARLTELLREPQTGVKDVAAVIACDVGMSAKILKLVNSAFFALAQPTGSIERAVCVLGTETLRTLALTLGAFECFRCAQAAEGCSIERMEKHSLAVGKLAGEMVAEPSLCDDAFTAGMLHDLGKLILGARAPDLMKQVLGHARQNNLPMHLAEAEILKVDHGDIGGFLLGLWNLPLPIVDAIANHHHPRWTAGRKLDIPLAVYLADTLVREASPSSYDGCSQELIFPDPALVRELDLGAKLDAWRARAAELVG